MKLKNKILLAISSSLIAGAVNAQQIDFRHEWRGTNHQEASRVKLSNSFPVTDKLRTALAIEMKFAAFDRTKTFDNIYLTETELTLGVSYKLSKSLKIAPGMPIAITDRKITFKPQVRVTYKSSFGLTTALRYRHEFANYSDPTDGNRVIDGDSNNPADTINDPQKSKVTLTGGYKIAALPNLKLNYEANFIKSWDDIPQFDNKDWEYDAGLIVGYQLGAWRPFAEIWNIDNGSSSDERQVRYRLGVKYKF